MKIDELSPRKGAYQKIIIMANILKNLESITLYIKWGNISKDYFGFSRSWIYQRLNGYDGNGNKCEFTDEQKNILRDALRDIARRLNEAADKI